MAVDCTRVRVWAESPEGGPVVEGCQWAPSGWDPDAACANCKVQTRGTNFNLALHSDDGDLKIELNMADGANVVMKRESRVRLINARCRVV